MPPIVSIVGHSKSGKTTLIEKLVGELKIRGYRVATVKHTPHGADFDQPGKDSWRHLQAGSEATLIISPDRVVLIKPVSASARLDEVIHLFGEDYDIILAEGFKQGNAPKIEVHRRESGPLLGSIRKLFAIATDEPLVTKTRQFSLEDVRGLVDLLETGFLKPKSERLSLYVNNKPIPLSTFPRKIISSTLVAIASSLKGVSEVISLEFFFRRGKRGR